jgi:hypothetical protein
MKNLLELTQKLETALEDLWEILPLPEPRKVYLKVTDNRGNGRAIWYTGEVYDAKTNQRIWCIFDQKTKTLAAHLAWKHAVKTGWQVQS